MNEFITKLKNGELSETEVKEFEGKLSEEGKKLLKEALAFTTKRQDESTKAADLEKKATELAENIRLEEEKLSQLKSQGTQFRQEQVDKAKAKFFADFKIPAEKQADYEAKFKALDSGKVDSELVYQDFVGVHAFLNKDELLGAQKEKIAAEQRAAEEAARAAGGGNGTPPTDGNQPKKFSDATTKLSKDAGITEEAADKIMKQGMERVIGE